MTDIVKQNRWVQAAFVLTFGVAGTFVIIQSHAATPRASIEAESGTPANGASLVTDSTASGGSAVKFGSAGSCTVTALLVNPCRPWFGGAVAGDPLAPGTDLQSQVTYYEQHQVDRPLDIIHTYHAVGHNTLTSDDMYIVDRPNTLLYANWKPASPWTSGYNSACTSTAVQTSSTPNNCDSGSASDSAIDSMANSIKSVGPHKIFLTIWHEPENDVSADDSSDGAACQNSVTNNGLGGFKGSANNTTTEYVKMWDYTRNRMTAIDGVTNVVWVMNYMGYKPWDCLVPDLWPGNSYVDWLTIDSYGDGNTPTWAASVGRFYNVLEADNSTTNNFESKTWGSAEFGDCNTAAQYQSNIYSYYASIKTALDNNTYPRIKMYMIYQDNGNNAGMGCLTDYDINGTYDANEQAAFNLFADDPNISGSFTNPY